MASLSLHNLVLPFSELSNQDNQFTFQVDDKGLSNILNYDVENVVIEVRAQKTGDGFLVNLDLKGSASLVCDRCGEMFSQPLEGKIQTLFLPAHDQDDEDDSVDNRYYDASDKGLFIEQDLLDAVSLSVPVKKLCKTSCKGLCDHCGANLNMDNCQCDQEKTDPRWDALKKLKFDDS